MKNSILISICLVAVFFFAGTTEVKADWEFEVGWNHTYCSCGTIVSKALHWEIRKISDNSLFASGNKDVTSLSSPQTITGTEIPAEDEQYRVCARIYYYDASIEPLCCQGEDCEPTDSAGLEAGDVELDILMY